MLISCGPLSHKVSFWRSSVVSGRTMYSMLDHLIYFKTFIRNTFVNKEYELLHRFDLFGHGYVGRQWIFSLSTVFLFVLFCFVCLLLLSLSLEQ